jgi:hypothetical protein
MDMLFDMFLQAQSQSISETTFGRMSDLIGSFTIFPKSAEPRGISTLNYFVLLCFY